MSLTSRLLAQAIQRRAFASATSDAVAKATASGQGILARLETLAEVPAGQQPGMLDTAGQVYIPKNLGKWPMVPADFKEFPERDLVNFPHPNVTEYPSKVRLGVIPDSWFRFFYEKTGETGGYLFLGGLATTLLSTEMIVMDVELYHPLPHAFNIFMITLLAGGKIAKYADDVAESEMADYATWKERQLMGFKQTVEAEEHLQKCYQVINDMLFSAKRENVQLQLEAAYRDRVNTVHTTVKRRMEFLSEYEATKRRFSLQHNIDWVMEKVRASVTPQMETATLKQCVSDLKTLAQKA